MKPKGVIMKHVPHRLNNICKILETRLYLLCPRNGKKRLKTSVKLKGKR
jgi:hypothetical protein